VGKTWCEVLHLVSSQALSYRHQLTFVYSIFDAIVNGLSYLAGAVHFQEVAFVFYNTEGLGYPQNGGPNPLGGPERESLLVLAKQMCRMWISFVNYGDPNMHLGGKSILQLPMRLLFTNHMISACTALGSC
jgi:carboxylesterase type B